MEFLIFLEGLLHFSLLPLSFVFLSPFALSTFLRSETEEGRGTIHLSLLFSINNHHTYD